MPEVGINGLMLDYPNSGSAVYTRNLASTLPSVASDLEFTLFTRQTSFEAPGIRSKTLASPMGRINRGQGPGARFDKLVWETLSLPVASARNKQSIIHSPYWSAPPWSAAPVVTTIHDLIPLVLPGYHRTRQSALYSRFMALTARRAAAIITVSNHSKLDIVRVLRIPESRVRVTYEAADCRFTSGKDKEGEERLRQKYGLPERFFLYLGSSERRKNLELLIRAWRRVAPHMRKRNTHLVLVARFPPPDALYPDTPALVHSLGLGDSVMLVSEVDEDDKPALYRCALAFCFPSIYEGFGLPLLEAMASGVPVIASRATSIPEVVGEAGRLLDPQDSDAWAEAMTDLEDSTDARTKLRACGLDRARLFSWRQTAEQTAQIYRELIAR